MRSLFQSGKTSVSSTKFLAVWLCIIFGASMVLAGGLPVPPDDREAPVEGPSYEVEEPSYEVEEPSSEVEEPSYEVEEPSSEVEEPSYEVEEPSYEVMTEEKKDSGFTLGVRGFLSILSSDTLSSSPTINYGPLDSITDYDPGYNLSLMLGYAFGNGLRIEAEGGYINNGLKEIDVKTLGVFINHLESGENKLEGDLSGFLTIVNAYYDIDLGSSLIPYIGAGLGTAYFTSEMKSGYGENVLVDESNTSVYVYQVSAGLGYKISGDNNGPDVTLSLDYRYLASTENLRFKQNVTGTTRVETDFGGHYIGGGVSVGLW